ncbi:wax ester/triacylglycerol synthase family O-acyltransferase [Gordonia sp. VNQ95]|uniref:WS/DGAT/MGAT family O-acyltransferase n=1 Tax=Gordonia sp. VNQ95 TaxID=3156619 RepID=UPI0032B505D9
MKRLSGWDASLLYGETPNVHMHTLKIAIIDPSDIGGFTVDQFRDTLRRRLHLLPPLQYRLVDVPLQLHHPLWLENCPVDLDYHVRERVLAGAAGRRELDDAIGEIASVPLDRDKPLWEFTFVEGLVGGRIAVVGKVHHALADGVASGNLLARATERASNAPSEREPHTPDALPTNGQLIRGAFADHARQVTDVPALVRDSSRGLRRVRRTRGERPEGLAKPFDPPPTFMNHVLTPGRRFSSTSMPLGDVREIAKTLGLKLNDVVLGLAAGALRRALIVHDGNADRPLIVSVPVSLDTSPERISGNRLSTLFVSLPVDVDDAEQRCRVAHQASTLAKDAHERLGPELMSDWLDFLPPAVGRRGLGRLSRRSRRSQLMNLPVSNVKGPSDRRYVLGAPITELYSVGPLSAGCAVNLTVWSYVDQLNFSMLVDSDTLGNPAR